MTNTKLFWISGKTERKQLHPLLSIQDKAVLFPVWDSERTDRLQTQSAYDFAQEKYHVQNN